MSQHNISDYFQRFITNPSHYKSKSTELISFIKTFWVTLGKVYIAQFIWIHHIIHFLLFAISGIVFPQCPHQDHRHQAHQEDHHHEGVKYGEPVNLSVKGKMNE